MWLATVCYVMPDLMDVLVWSSLALLMLCKKSDSPWSARLLFPFTLPLPPPPVPLGNRGEKGYEERGRGLGYLAFING